MHISRLLSLFSISFLAVAAVLLAITPPSSGYEISIYSAYSLHFWIFLVASLICAFALIVYSVYEKIKSNAWLIGMIVILAVNSIILLLPVFRGYFFYGRTDPGQHYGFVKDIILTGHYGAPMSPFENFYPASHIFVASLAQVTGLDSRIITLITPWLFWLLYVLSMLILAKLVALNREQFILITTFSLPLSFIYLQSSFFPSILLFFFAPLTLFLLFRRVGVNSRLNYSILLVLILVIIPFIHAGDTLSFLILFACIGITVSIYAWVNHSREILTIRNMLTTVTILCVIWISWFFSFRMFGTEVNRIYNWLLNGTDISPAMLKLSILERAHANFFDAIQVLLSTHSHNLLFIVIAGVIIIYWWRKPSNVNIIYIVFSCIFIVFLILTPIFFFLPAVGEYRRVLPYAIMAATIVIGFGITDWIQRNKFNKLALLAVIGILSVTSIMGIFSVHYSPFIDQANQQVTRYDISGMTWFLQHQNGKNLIDQQRVMQYTLSSIILGNQATPKNVRWGTNQEYQTPSHFGYDKTDRYGQNYSADRYFLNDKLSRIVAPTLFPKFAPYWRWNYSDWANLENDPSVLRIYDNLEFEVYYIRSG